MFCWLVVEAYWVVGEGDGEELRSNAGGGVGCGEGGIKEVANVCFCGKGASVVKFGGGVW